MLRNEEFCFRGAGLDRAAAERGDTTALWQRPDTRVLPIWRGKPLMTGEPAGALCWCAPEAPGQEAATEPPVFLGLSGGAPRFARDLSAWEPREPAATLGAFFDPSEQVHPDLPAGSRFAELRGAMTRLPPAEAELAATARSLTMWHRSHRFCARCGAASLPAQSGWQRDCPACGASHYPRTDPVVIMLITHGNRVLLGRSPGWPDGMYSMLAGYVEPGESPEDAVRREVFEEAGVRVGAVRYLASQPWPFPSSLMMAWAGEAESTEITIDPSEIEDAQWVEREELAAILRRDHPTMTAARRGAIARAILVRWLRDDLHEAAR